jgi:ADP-ribose pyrophosphatase YjhB (NUDIX family)
MEKSKSVLARTNFANVVVSVAIEKDGQFLMMQESKKDIYGKWNFPAGKVEVGETIIDSAKREALEESGFDVELTGLISVYYINWDNNDGITVRYNFKAKLVDENQKPKDLAGDVLKTVWMTIEQIQKLSAAGELRSPNTVRLANEVEAGKVFPLEILYTN